MSLHLTECEIVPAPFRSIRNIEQQQSYVASLPAHSSRRAKEQAVLEMMKHEQLQQELQRSRGYAARRAAMAMREANRA